MALRTKKAGRRSVDQMVELALAKAATRKQRVEKAQGQQPKEPDMKFAKTADFADQEQPDQPNQGQKRRNKYGANTVFWEGKEFDSIAERDRYVELYYMERLGEISQLSFKPVYELLPSMKICGQTYPATKYTPDHSYMRDGVLIVEDVKGFDVTAEFQLKRKLMKHVHNIDVFLWRKNGDTRAKPSSSKRKS